MSKALEMIEEAADDQELITNPDIIRDVLNRFLNMTFSELVDGNEKFTFITDDIARGFELDEVKLRDIKIRDLLILIGFEPGLEYFAIPKDEHWFYDHNPDPKFYSAGHCIYLGNLINMRKKKHPVLESLCRIDFEAFTKYLRDVVAHSGYPGRHIRDMDWGLSAMNACVFEFIEDNSYMDEDEELLALSLGEVLENLFNIASRPWRCECFKLGTFISRTFEAYRLMRNIFMTGIRMTIVKGHRMEMSRLTKMYGKAGSDYKDIFDTINFENCYE